jgi:UDP-N-acetylglucosamine--N-acetylmuramyl-(pentapeptide) pyrophosphoryl-undecaprenol N-acetylglucosamine transferase
MVGAETVLLVASSGGHLAELEALAPRLAPPGWERAWLAPSGEQADALLARGETVHLLRPTGPRDWRSTLANMGPVRRALAAVRPTAMVSTGAAVAVPAFALGRLLGVELHYIESAARTDGPSVTGQLVARVPGARMYTQWSRWSDECWAATGSVFDPFDTYRLPEPRPVLRLVVTLGTQARYGFRRLVEQLVSVIPPAVEVLWQVGATDTSGLDLEAQSTVPPLELAEAMSEADVIVAHAGVGSSLLALEAGRRPLLVPRRKAFREHVDDHQSLIGAAIARRRLAAVVEADRLTWADIEESAHWEVQTRPASRLALGGQLGGAGRTAAGG